MQGIWNGAAVRESLDAYLTSGLLSLSRSFVALEEPELELENWYWSGSLKMVSSVVTLVSAGWRVTGKLQVTER